MSFLPFLHRVSERENLGALDARLAMGMILSGEVTPVQIAAFLTALKVKGESSEELVGFARAMRRVATSIATGLGDLPLIDTCGTGGDGAGTFNISTVAAFVIAGAGVHVAKHGNRSISSPCGSADLMEALGVDLSLHPDDVGRAIRDVGIGFLFAPAIHTAMKYAQPVRIELKMRTVFNLLGPLTNPAGANAQLVGAPSDSAAELMANALASLGLKRAFVVRGSDGLDEITTTGSTLVFEVSAGHVRRRVFQPQDFGVPVAGPEDLKGGDKNRNLEIARAIFSGEKGPKRDIVVVNASAALVAAGRARDLAEGVRLAVESLDSGAAAIKARQLAEFCRTTNRARA